MKEICKVAENRPVKSLRLETHVHTKYSKDSMLLFWPLYLKCRILNISYIAVTDHNNIEGGQKFSNFCKKRGDKVKVIVGEEIFTADGEIIGLFLKERVLPNLSAETTVNEILGQNGIVYIPHPYDQKRRKTVLTQEALSLIADQVDCVEIHNGRNISKEYDIMQKEIADQYGFVPVVGSDAHTWIEIGRNCMEVTVFPDTSENFRKAILHAKLQGKDCICIAHKITKIVKLLKLIRKGNINELCRIITRKTERNIHRGSG